VCRAWAKVSVNASAPAIAGVSAYACAGLFVHPFEELRLKPSDYAAARE
jgi:hypothetical protein